MARLRSAAADWVRLNSLCDFARILELRGGEVCVTGLRSRFGGLRSVWRLLREREDGMMEAP